MRLFLVLLLFILGPCLIGILIRWGVTDGDPVRSDAGHARGNEYLR